jgi:hypothetical protein
MEEEPDKRKVREIENEWESKWRTSCKWEDIVYSGYRQEIVNAGYPGRALNSNDT